MKRRGDPVGETDPVHGQRAAGGHAARLGALENEAVHGPKLGLQQAGGVGKMLSLQRIGAHQLPEAGIFVGRAVFYGLHFDQPDGNPPLCQLPGRFAARQSRADDGDGCLLIHGCS